MLRAFLLGVFITAWLTFLFFKDLQDYFDIATFLGKLDAVTDKVLKYLEESSPIA
jgi:hypothetical protein